MTASLFVLVLKTSARIEMECQKVDFRQQYSKSRFSKFFNSFLEMKRVWLCKTVL